MKYISSISSNLVVLGTIMRLLTLSMVVPLSSHSLVAGSYNKADIFEKYVEILSGETIKIADFADYTFISSMLGVLLQIVTTIILTANCQTGQNKNLRKSYDLGMLLWLNPVMAYSGVHSLRTSLSHFVLVACISSCGSGWNLLSVLPVTTLLFLRPNFFIVVPALLLLLWSAQSQKLCSPRGTAHRIAALCILFAVAIGCVVVSSHIGNTISLPADILSVDSAVNILRDVWYFLLKVVCARGRNIHSMAPQLVQSYTPAAGVWWYLDAQMLPEFAHYFEILVAAQPVACAALIYHKIGKSDPEITVYLSIAVTVFYSRDASLADVWFLVALFCCRPQVVEKMRSVPWIAAGLLVPSVLSPLVLDMWSTKGTANANYLFFQALCMWVFLALGIVEYVTAFCKITAATGVGHGVTE